jgi:hypothetical protein
MSSYVIVGIHGLNNKPPEDRLKAFWIKAITEGLRRNLNLDASGIEFELVYWADLMYDKSLEPDPGPLIAHPDPRQYDLAPYTEAEGVGPLPQHEKSLLHKIKTIGKEMLGGIFDKGIALPGVSKVTDEVVEHKAIDLHRYYEDPDKRRAIRQRLSEALRAANDGGRRDHADRAFDGFYRGF